MTDIISTLLLNLDRFIIYFYRVPDHPLLGFFMGSTALAFMCILAGELSVSLAIRVNKSHIDALNDEMTGKERMSMIAYQMGDKKSYKALNKAATDAWGKRFFTMAAYSAGILWPVPLALGWLDTRFQEVQFALAFPLSLVFGNTVGYAFTFIPLYILCRILFKYMRPYLPYFRGVQRLLSREKTP